MRIRLICFVSFFALTLFLAITFAVEAKAENSLAKEEEIDRVVAAIDGEPLTMRDLLSFISENGGKVNSSDSSLDKFKELHSYLGQMISRKLLELEALNRGVSVSDNEVKAYVDEVIRKNGVSAEEFEAMLGQEGMSLKMYRQQVKGEILKTRIVQSLVHSSVSISDEDIERYVNENKELLPQEGQIHLYQILLEVPNGATEAQLSLFKDRLEELRDKLVDVDMWPTVQGVSFSDVGYVKENELIEELRLAVKDLPTNKVSDVVFTNNGMYLLMVLARGGDDWKLNKKFTESIREELYRAKSQERMKKFITEELTGKYHVEMLLTESGMHS